MSAKVKFNIEEPKKEVLKVKSSYGSELDYAVSI